jgi:hypothetical protein
MLWWIKIISKLYFPSLVYYQLVHILWASIVTGDKTNFDNTQRLV